MSWATALTFMCIGFAALCALCVVRPKKRNKLRGLPPPSDACKRNSTQAVP